MDKVYKALSRLEWFYFLVTWDNDSGLHIVIAYDFVANKGEFLFWQDGRDLGAVVGFPLAR
jgi:hypothetical protein